MFFNSNHFSFLLHFVCKHLYNKYNRIVYYTFSLVYATLGIS